MSKARLHRHEFYFSTPNNVYEIYNIQKENGLCILNHKWSSILNSDIFQERLKGKKIPLMYKPGYQEFDLKDYASIDIEGSLGIVYNVNYQYIEVGITRDKFKVLEKMTDQFQHAYLVPRVLMTVDEKGEYIPGVLTCFDLSNTYRKDYHKPLLKK